jgi:formylglycine-generating enzyme required for sulfatase activity
MRGGSWFNFPRNCRSVYRYRDQPGYANDVIGFRVVCLPQEEAPCRAVLRGGGWDSLPSDRRLAHRGIDLPGYTDDYIGFRVICLPPS